MISRLKGSAVTPNNGWFTLHLLLPDIKLALWQVSGISPPAWGNSGQYKSEIFSMWNHSYTNKVEFLHILSVHSSVQTTFRFTGRAVNILPDILRSITKSSEITAYDGTMSSYILYMYCYVYLTSMVPCSKRDEYPPRIQWHPANDLLLPGKHLLYSPWLKIAYLGSSKNRGYVD